MSKEALKKYRAGEVTVEARQWFRGDRRYPAYQFDYGMFVDTRNGVRDISDGDWLVKGADGFWDVVKGSVFNERYEAEDVETSSGCYVEQELLFVG